MNYKRYYNYYLLLITFIILYNEQYGITTNSLSSSRIYRDQKIFDIKINKCEINKIISIFYNHIKNRILYKKNKYTERMKHLFFKESFYEAKSKLKIVGRGWKITKYGNQLFIRLGYSHYIYDVLAPTMKQKNKKKKIRYYVYYSIDYEKIEEKLNRFTFMKLPNLFTNKGIYHRVIKC